MTDSQGNVILPGMKLKSSESKRCIPAIEMISEELFKDLINPFRKPFRMNQNSMTNSKWIIVANHSVPRVKEDGGKPEGK